MGFWALWDNIYVCVFCYNPFNSNAVKGLWPLWDNIYNVHVVITVAIVMRLRDFGPYEVFLMCVLLKLLQY
jgi:hypothetical protein